MPEFFILFFKTAISSPNKLFLFYFTYLETSINHLGYRPQESKGTIIRVPVSLTREFVHGAWSAKIAQTNQERVRLQITSPPDAVVGRYHLYVETKTSVPGVEKETDFRYQHPEEIIMLFNPWCKGK